MRLLVTGAAGQIGRRLVSKALESDYEVIPVTHRDCDIRDYESLAEWFRLMPDIVVHLASHLPNTVNPDFAGVNVNGTRNVVKLCERAGVKNLVFASSMRVYAIPPVIPVNELHKLKPVENYGKSKLACEVLVHTSNVKSVIIRYGGVYGNGDFGVVHKFLTSDMITVQGNGSQSTDFIHVDDAVDGTLLLLNNEGVFNVSSGEETTIMRLAILCRILTGAEIITDVASTDRPFRFVSDVTRIKRLGLRPRALEQGIADYWRELNDNR